MRYRGAWFVVVLSATACAEGAVSESTADPGPSGSGPNGSGGWGGSNAVATTGSGGGGEGGEGGTTCSAPCSGDWHDILDCNGDVIESCTVDQACDPETSTCTEVCEAAASHRSSVGCEFYASMMETMNSAPCLAAFVTNTWTTPAQIAVEHMGTTLPIASFARIPVTLGPSVDYLTYDAVNGLAPGQTAIIFLAGAEMNPFNTATACPIAPAVAGGAPLGTSLSTSFRITSNVPVAAYQMQPYGQSTDMTGASLLLPTTAWDTNYVAANAYSNGPAPPSLNIVAKEDDTLITMLPVNAVSGGGGIPGGPAGQPLTFFLDRGQQAQITQALELTGSAIEADKRIGLMAGHRCMNVPSFVGACDHGEQMLPPVRALGSRYVGVMHRPRFVEPAAWRLVGVVDGTQLTWSSPVGGPATLNRGDVFELMTDDPFVVDSQDADHPFMLMSLMLSNQHFQVPTGFGDPETVVSIPTSQYLRRYAFVTSPVSPDSNLVVVRSKHNGAFYDVELDCLGVLTGWEDVGSYQWTRVDLRSGSVDVGACNTGSHDIWSDAPFGLWVWGWGPSVSYGYPGGMSVRSINDVYMAPN